MMLKVPDHAKYNNFHGAESEALLVEDAWEVSNQLGGIYTVLKTKAAAMRNRWGDNNLMVGPYNPEAAAFE